MQILESRVEQEFCDLVAKNQLKVFVLKMNPDGRTGVPDRLCILPGGKTVFIEFKREGEEARERQLHIHSILRKLDHDVRIFDNAQEAFRYIRRKVDT